MLNSWIHKISMIKNRECALYDFLYFNLKYVILWEYKNNKNKDVQKGDKNEDKTVK